MIPGFSKLCGFLLLAFCITFPAGAREAAIMSKPVDIRQKGFNKVVCMKNGNTLLFHVEAYHEIIVKVFDSAGKEIAHRNDVSHTLDVFAFSDPILLGAYDINGQAVLFIEQEIKGKYCLARLQYDATTGKLVNEGLVGESSSANRRMQFYVLKNKESDNYEIFFCTDVRHPRKYCEMFIVYFNKNHESVREIHLPVDRKKYDYLKVAGAESQPCGELITISLDKTIEYGRPDHNTPLVEGGAVYDHYLSFYFIPRDSANPRMAQVDVTPYVYPYSSFYTYNPADQNLDLLLFNYHPYDYSFGMNRVVGSVQSDHLFRINKDNMSLRYGRIRDSLANKYLQEQTDTSFSFTGAPVKMATDEAGITTLVSISQTGNLEVHYNFVNTTKYIGITRFDSGGKETWGTVLPLPQYYNRLLPYGRQFLSVNTYNINKNCYIIFNDYDKDLDNSLRHPGPGVYDYSVTNTFYFKIDGENRVTKNYLYGDPQKEEYKCSFILGADCDLQRGRYAALVQYQKRGKTTLNMAWAQLE